MKEVLTLTPFDYRRADNVFPDLMGYLVGHLRHPLVRWDDLDGTVHVVCEKCSDDGTTVTPQEDR